MYFASIIRFYETFIVNSLYSHSRSHPQFYVIGDTSQVYCISPVKANDLISCNESEAVSQRESRREIAINFQFQFTFTTLAIVILPIRVLKMHKVTVNRNLLN